MKNQLDFDIPAAWRSGLAAIQTTAKRHAVIAGGALRDLDHKVRVKDIDVFVGGDKESDVAILHNALLAAGWLVEDIDQTKFYPIGENNEVVGFFEAQPPMRGASAPPFQIIIVKWDTRRIVDRFDFGICKIAFDGGSQVIVHEDYEIDKAAKQFRICRPRDREQLVASVHRYARLSVKYPNWPFRLFKEKIVLEDDIFG